MSDKRSRTLTVGELIRALESVDPSTPVVMDQDNEPVGDYGVRAVDITERQRDPSYADGIEGMDAWHDAEAYFPAKQWNDRYEPPQQVVFLSRACLYRAVEA